MASSEATSLYSFSTDYEKVIPPSIPTVVGLTFEITELSDIDDQRNVSRQEYFSHGNGTICASRDKQFEI